MTDIVQTKSVSLSGGNQNIVLDAPVTDGNAVIAIVSGPGTGRTLTMSNATHGAFASAVSVLQLQRGAYAFYLLDVNGGETTFTSGTNFTSDRQVVLIEVSGLGSVPVITVGSSNTDGGTATTSHPCATPGIDISGDSLVVAIGSMSGAGTITRNAAFSSEYKFTLPFNGVGQWGVFASPLTAFDGAWVSSIARTHQCVMASFAPEPADTTPPTVVSATITTTGSNETLTVNFSEAVTGGATGLTVNAGGGPIALTYVSGSGTSTLVFTTSSRIASGATVTLSYAAGNIEDLAFNALATITNAAVTNSSSYTPDLSAPTCVSAVLTSDQLVLTFSEDVTGTAGFVVTSSAPPISVSSSGVAGNAITLSLNRVPVDTESLLVTYTPGNVADLASNAAAAFSILVTNNNSSGGVSGQFRGIRNGGSL